MNKFMRQIWVSSCSIILFITYLLCFSSATSVDLNRASAQELMTISRNVVVENANACEQKEFKREDKQVSKEKYGLPPLMPLVCVNSLFVFVVIKKIYGNYIHSYIQEAFAPSLGANAPPFILA